MSPDLRHLRYFVVVAEELNFTRAAARLFLAQQALSAAVRQLEDDLGVRLFERTTRKVTLTPAGAALVPQARRLLALADEVFDNARAGAQDPPLLRVDIASSGLEMGVVILRELRQTWPTMGVQQIEYGVPRGLEELRTGGLDVLFGNAVHAPDDIAAELVRLEPIQVMIPAHHPCAATAEVPVAALADELWLLPSDELAPEWTEQVVSMCQQAGFRPRRYPGITHGAAAAAELVAEGRCVTPTIARLDVPAGVAMRPLVRPAALFPWSMMWLDEGTNAAATTTRGEALSRLLEVARTTSRSRGWLKEQSEYGD
jgi:DNA-binding transcriptional LysR family regulator